MTFKGHFKCILQYLKFKTLKNLNLKLKKKSSVIDVGFYKIKHKD